MMPVKWACSERMAAPSPARMTRTSRVGGSTRRLKGTPRATASAHSVSMLGLPLPASNWDSVDLEMLARRASSDSDTSARSRSRRMAMASSGLGGLGVRFTGMVVLIDERQASVHIGAHGKRGSRPRPGCGCRGAGVRSGGRVVWRARGGGGAVGVDGPVHVGGGVRGGRAVRRGGHGGGGGHAGGGGVRGAVAQRAAPAVWDGGGGRAGEAVAHAVVGRAPDGG